MNSLPAESARFIASSMEHVQVNESALDKLAQLLTDQVRAGEYDIAKWKADNPLHPQQMDHSAAEWIFVVDSLNFSFWPDTGKEFSIEGKVGYWALVAAINRALKEKIPITDARYYSKLTLEEAGYIFRTDQQDIAIPMLPERVQVLNENGRALVEKFDSSFVSCIQEAEGSALKLLSIVYDHFPSFRDESVYHGRQVTFLKRAQILVADLWGCFEGRHLGRFDDIDQLTMFADYRIPQALHYFDVLIYSDQLTSQLKANSLLENGSAEEIEIRGASIHAVELLRAQMARLVKERGLTLPTPNSIQIDFYLWGFRRDNASLIDLKSPYHKVRSIFY